MSILLLRKMTFKSKIGFGRYPDLTVKELIDIGKASELIYMYYGLDRIDFVQEVKDELCIEEITKPGKILDRIEKNNICYKCIGLYMEKGKLKDEKFAIKIGNYKKAEDKCKLKIAKSKTNWAASKIVNRGRNQK